VFRVLWFVLNSHLCNYESSLEHRSCLVTGEEPITNVFDSHAHALINGVQNEDISAIFQATCASHCAAQQYNFSIIELPYGTGASWSGQARLEELPALELSNEIEHLDCISIVIRRVGATEDISLVVNHAATKAIPRLSQVWLGLPYVVSHIVGYDATQPPAKPMTTGLKPPATMICPPRQ